MITPWGKADSKKEYAPGIVFYSTPGHGGFKVNKPVLAVMPKRLQNADGWYEEDCEACKVIAAFPHLFTPEQVQHSVEFVAQRYDEQGKWIDR